MLLQPTKITTIEGSSLTNWTLKNINSVLQGPTLNHKRGRGMNKQFGEMYCLIGRFNFCICYDSMKMSKQKYKLFHFESAILLKCLAMFCLKTKVRLD